MRCRLLVVSALLAITGPLTAEEYRGKILSRLGLNDGATPCATAWTPPPDSSLPFPVKPGDTVYMGRLHWHPDEQMNYRIAAVESRDGSAVLYVDLNRDGKVSADEIFPFQPLRSDPQFEQQVYLRVALPNSRFASFPMKIRFYRRGKENICTNYQRAVVCTTEAYVMARVNVRGRRVLVGYYFQPRENTVDPRSGPQGMDTNGDGKITFLSNSPEFSYWPTVFRVGRRYLSTKSVDLENGEVVLESHPAGDYHRVELRMGVRMPDFPFTDFDGRRRRTSEFRGRYLLLNIWEEVCGPCLAEFPFLKQAYERFQGRGLEILGINTDSAQAGPREILEKYGATWPQATGESTTGFVRDRLSVASWPTMILINPSGRIVSVDDDPRLSLRGDKMLATLNKVLPAARAARGR